MSWHIHPDDYQDALTDFVRSGIHIHYASIDTTINNNWVQIFFPYITGRQYFIYKESHLITSYEDSLSYQISSVGEPDDETIEKFHCDDDFLNWEYFQDAFKIKPAMFRHRSNRCYAFIRFDSIRFLDIPLYGADLHLFSNDINIGADIQKHHIADIYAKYNEHNPFYPLRMNLDWLYLVKGELLPIDTILDMASPIYNIIDPDNFIANYIITQFPYKSEAEIIENFKEMRNNYCQNDYVKELEWYQHTISIIDKLFFLNKVSHIKKKVRILKAFCQNRGRLHRDVEVSTALHLYNTALDYDGCIRLYSKLVEKQYIEKDSLKTDFAYYMTGEGDCTYNVIRWKGQIIELAACISGITKKTHEVEWTVLSQVFVDKKAKPINIKSIKSAFSRARNTQSFKEMQRRFFNFSL